VKLIRSVPVLAVLLVALSACAAPAAAPPTVPESSTQTPTPTETPLPTEQAALVLGVAGVTAIDATGASEIIPYTAADALIELISRTAGATPEIESTPKGDVYRWSQDVSIFVLGTSATVRFGVADLNGTELRTADGIEVGSTRAEVDGLSPFLIDYDGDGDGLPDTLGLEPTPEPGTESLVVPGAVGTTYVVVIFSGDTVTGLAAPAGDWRDI